eukprot:403368412
MSLNQTSLQQISQHTLNTSTSKALFSFSKAERRSMAIKTVTDVVGYDVPDFKSQRACSFGIGDRKIPRTSDSPPPTCYNLKSVFDNKKPDGKAFTFGLSKEHFQRVYLENHPARDRDIPGPGEYNPQEKIGEKSQKITISGRTNNPLLLTSQRFVPGPGTYEPRNSINKNGQYVLSNMKSTLTPSFSLPSLAGKLEPGRKMDQVELMKYVPGPGSYTPKLFLGDRTVSSNHQSASQKSFYHHDRFPATTKSLRKDMPGPGSYQTISEFNLYAPLTTTNKTFKTQRNSQFDQTIDLKNSSLYSNNPKISEVKKELPSQTQSFVQQVKQNSQASNTNHQKTLSVQVKQDSQPKEGYIAQLDNNSKLKNHTKSKIESSGKKSIVKVNDARLKKESKSLQDTLAQSKPLLLDKQKVTSQQKPFDQPQKGHIKTEQNVSVLKEETQSKIQTQVEQQQHQLKQIQAQQDIQSLPTWQRRKTEITAESQVFNPKPKQSPPLSDQSQIQSKQPSQNPSGLSQNQPPPVLSHNQSENQKPTDLHNNVGNGVVEVKENRRRQQEGVPSQLKQDL